MVEFTEIQFANPVHFYISSTRLPTACAFKRIHLLKSKKVFHNFIVYVLYSSYKIHLYFYIVEFCVKHTVPVKNVDSIYINNKNKAFSFLLIHQLHALEIYELLQKAHTKKDRML